MFFYELFQNNFEILTPLFFLTTVILIILLFCTYLINNQETSKIINNSILNLLVVYSLTLSLILTYFTIPMSIPSCNGLVIYDDLSKFIQSFLICCSIIFTLLQYTEPNYQQPYYFEQTIISLLSIIGLLLLNISYNFILLYLALELQSLSFYILAASRKNSPVSAEASLKYFILGAIASGFLLYGISIIYGITGSLNFGNIFTLLTHFDQCNDFHFLISFSYGLIFLCSGLLFKIGAAPFHIWLPDVYDGSPNMITLFFAIFPKMVFINLLVRIFFDICSNIFDFFTSIFYCCSLLSILIGSFLALQQKKIKRLLAYSSISHIGFLLIGFTFNNYQNLEIIFFYLMVYTIMTLNIWIVFLSIKKKGNSIKYLTDFTNLSKLNPILSILLILNLFSMAGIPPLAGFFSKMFVFSLAIKNSLIILSIISILVSVVSTFYYIRLIKVIWFDKSNRILPMNELTKIESFLISISSIFICFYFIFPEYIIIFLQKLTLLFIL